MHVHLEARLKHDEELLKTTLQSLFCRTGVLLIWILLLVGIYLSILLLRP